MELNALVGAPAAPNGPTEESENMVNVAGDEPFDTLDTFLRELQADLAEASQPTSTTTPTGASYRRQRYNIAAANPLLAGKLPTVGKIIFINRFTFQFISCPVDKSDEHPIIFRKISNTIVTRSTNFHSVHIKNRN